MYKKNIQNNVIRLINNFIFNLVCEFGSRISCLDEDTHFTFKEGVPKYHNDMKISKYRA